MFYQLNLYYAVHFEIEYNDRVMAILKKNKKFIGLSKKAAEIKLQNATISSSTNSDKEPTSAFIFIEEMTTADNEYEKPEEVFNEFDASELIKKEKKYIKAITVLEEIADLIRKSFPGEKDLKDIRCKWLAINCEWDDESDSE
jgi:hypothetical protein